ncbi:GNAT family N-acetyltransferase [Pseudomonas aeruginosa]|uniref:GNAT family N-acetyltransferase n=1 Tax=Pseudomonas aeruginosa TaxID=287 RepID=UPI0032B43CE5|nr:GNAT family N-acetyltransferase [Pseudomonas aeruginosa]
MPAMANPFLALASFQQAFLSGEIKPQLCQGHNELHVFQDEPEPGEKRLTYALIALTGKVRGYAIFVPADPIEGCPCFGVGYAVAEDERGQGIAQAMLESSIQELRKGLGPRLSARFPGFYVEAMVALDNIASNKVALNVLNSAPEETTEEISGERAFRYERFVSW